MAPSFNPEILGVLNAYILPISRNIGCYSTPCTPSSVAPALNYMPTNIPSYNMRRREGNLSIRILDYLLMDYLGHATFTFSFSIEMHLLESLWILIRAL